MIETLDAKINVLIETRKDKEKEVEGDKEI